MMKLQNNKQRGMSLFVVALLLLMSCTSGEVVHLRLKGAGRSYDAAVHEYLGRPILESTEALLMFPPENNVELCNTTTTTSSDASSSYFDLPIALLVELTSTCSTKEQAENAVSLFNQSSAAAAFLIFVSDNFLTPAVLPDPMVELDGLNENNTTMKKLGYLFVSLNSGRSMRRAIETVTDQLSSSSNASPYYGSTTTNDWNFSVEISPPNSNTTRDTARLYLVFLAMLSGIFIFAPCCLYSLRWWTWYRQQHETATETGNSNNMVQTVRRQGILLSRQQVYALPELVYHDQEKQVEQHVENSSDHLKTTSTVCSICIQDFQEGERVRLLPLCGHAYHTQCILPWLTLRAGTCPDCKTSVIKRDEEGNDGAAAMPEQAVVVTGLATNDNIDRRGDENSDRNEDARQEDRDEGDALPV